MTNHDHSRIGRRLTLKHFATEFHAVVSQTGRSQEVFEAMLEKQGIQRKVVLNIAHFTSVPFVVAQSDLIVTVTQRCNNPLREKPSSPEHIEGL